MSDVLALICDSVCKELGVESTPTSHNPTGGPYRHLFHRSDHIQRKNGRDAYICTIQLARDAGLAKLIWRTESNCDLILSAVNTAILSGQLPGTASFDLADPSSLESMSKLIHEIVKQESIWF